MLTGNPFPLVAVDVGNSRLKMAVFDVPFAEPLPHPHRAIAIDLNWNEKDLDGWLPAEPAAYTWSISSVNRPGASRLLQWLSAKQVPGVRLLNHSDLPVRVELPRPESVGLDRLANAVAANRLRAADEPAIVIALGSAVTVDLVLANGSFAGGAILPGLSMAARALHEYTDLLPLVEVSEPPPPLGKSTLAAMSSGLYWGVLGAVRELIARLSDGPIEPQLFMTGGDAPRFASVLQEPDRRQPQFVPHLTLAGIALAALESATAKDSR